MRNVLIVSDTFTQGGLETRVLGEISNRRKEKQKVFLVCHTYSKKHQSVFDDILKTNMPKENSQSILSIKNQIITFCQKHKIDLIECHPFNLSLPAVLAASEINIPITYTLHGATSANFILPEQPNLKLLYYLAIKYGFDEIYAVAEYLRDSCSFLSPNIKIVRNGTNIKKIIKAKKTILPNGKIAIASRIDGPKTKLITNFLPILEKIPDIKQIDIYGDGDQAESLKAFIKESNITKAKYLGWSDDLSRDLKKNNYNLAFGMGKVIFDIVESNTPAGILGYGGFIDIINDNNIKKYAETNLTNWKTISESEQIKIIADALIHPNNYLLSAKSLSIFDQDDIWQNLLKKEKEIKPKLKEVIIELNLLLQVYNHIGQMLNEFDQSNDLSLDVLYKDYRYQIQLNQIINNKDYEISCLKEKYNSIVESKFWKHTEKPRRILNKIHSGKKNKPITVNKPLPEIIAVICTCNEEINIDGCLSHIENFVDNIIIFDDGSTDNTIKIAKKHKKVSKIITNPHKNEWNERKNRKLLLNAAYQSSNKENTWVICIDADERLETRFLHDMRKIAENHSFTPNAFALHFRELWDSINQYRNDGIWNEKIKTIFFPLTETMTFGYGQEHHIPWIYRELTNNESLTDYNIYHLKMVKPQDRQQRANLYNKLDPIKIMQPIGYDYLTDTTNLHLQKITSDYSYDTSTVPEYYTS